MPRCKAALALGVTDPDGANKIWAEIDKAVTDNAPAAAAVHAEAPRLRVEAPGQFPVQLAILLDGHPVLGAVTGLSRDRGSDCNEPREPWPLGHGYAPAGARSGRHGGARRCSCSSSSCACWRQSMPPGPVLIPSPRRSMPPLTSMASSVPVMEQSTEGLGLGYNPIGPTWRARQLFPWRRQPGPRCDGAAALWRPQLAAHRRCRNPR